MEAMWASPVCFIDAPKYALYKLLLTSIFNNGEVHLLLI